MTSRTLIGVDVGGTFTDLVSFDAATGRIVTAKTPSQRGDEASGFLTGLEALGQIADFGAIVHGTTVGTNALLERKGARVGLITTPGFRDVLEMRRRDRPRTWGLRGDFIPVVERDLAVEVGERTLADGSVRVAVNAEEIAERARTLSEGRSVAGDRVRQRLRQSRQRARRGGGGARGMAERARHRLARDPAGNQRV